uniref:histone H1-like n=1 Tax=Pristiophorus japonicus TaxID=55135 RepID=UPI00398F84B5
MKASIPFAFLITCCTCKLTFWDSCNLIRFLYAAAECLIKCKTDTVSVCVWATNILKVVADGKDRRGMSLATIKKTLAAKGVDVEKRRSQIRFSNQKNVMNGSLKQIKGTGASGSFKIAKTDPQEKVGKKVKKPAAKKAAAKKSPAKKAATKKTSTKKAPTAKKIAKGPAGKKAAVKKPKSPKKMKATKKVENPRVKATSKSAKAKKAAPKK